MDDVDDRLSALETWLAGVGRLGVAVSGGVDSMTLAVVAHRVLGRQACMYHAVSPAVPGAATARVQRHAEREGWRLRLLDAEEFTDSRYRENPVNRCYFCKSHLYDAMADVASDLLVSGTNVDDLGDYRPGLEAARERAVRHPYVEVGIDKDGVRAIARRLSLDDLAELPAAPCLSSRIETGISIEPAMLGVVDEVERDLTASLEPRTVRCRVRRGAIVIELDPETLRGLGEGTRAALREDVAGRFRAVGLDDPVGFTTYQRGSAFLHEHDDA